MISLFIFLRKLKLSPYNRTLGSNLVQFVMLINKKDNAKYATYQQNPSDPLFFIRNETHFVSFIYLLLLKIIGLIRLCRQKKDAKKVHVYLLYIFFFKRKNKVWVIVYVIKRKSCTFTRHSEHNEFTRIYIYYISMYIYTYIYIYTLISIPKMKKVSPR